LKKRRFFAPSSQWIENKIFLDTDQTHHLKDVLRIKEGEEVICFDQTGRECSARILNCKSSQAELEINLILTANTTTCKTIALAQSLIKPAKMDFIIQKTVELGVDEIIPFRSAYCAVNLEDDRILKKSGRWNKIAVESSKQCGRKSVVRVEDMAGFEELIANCGNYDRIFLADRYYSGDLNVSDHLRESRKILAVVGPEGGFTANETDRFLKLPNCVRFNFNENVLRAETAAVSAVAILKYEWQRID